MGDLIWTVFPHLGPRFFTGKPMAGAEALAQLRLDLASSSIEQKLSGGRRIVVVAKLLGPAGARDTLLPLIKGACAFSTRTPV